MPCKAPKRGGLRTEGAGEYIIVVYNQLANANRSFDISPTCLSKKATRTLRTGCRPAASSSSAGRDHLAGGASEGVLRLLCSFLRMRCLLSSSLSLLQPGPVRSLLLRRCRRYLFSPSFSPPALLVQCLRRRRPRDGLNKGRNVGSRSARKFNRPAYARRFRLRAKGL